MSSPDVTTENTTSRSHVPKVRLAIIIGSIRTDRFCPTPARWIAEHARRRPDLDVDLIDLADAEVPPVLGGDSHDEPVPSQVAALGERLAAAEAFILVTPVYNRSFPGSVKNAIDWFYAEWQLKPIGFISYGGTFGGVESINALRTVFAEFDAVALADAITFPNFWETFDDDSRPVDAGRAAARATRMLEQLEWWATTLREGRSRRPYPSADTE